MDPLYQQLLELAQSVGTVALETLLTQVMLDAKYKMILSGTVLLVILVLTIAICVFLYKDDPDDGGALGFGVFGTFLCCFPITSMVLAAKMMANPMYYAMQMLSQMIQ